MHKNMEGNSLGEKKTCKVARWDFAKVGEEEQEKETVALDNIEVEIAGRCA